MGNRESEFEYPDLRHFFPNPQSEIRNPQFAVCNPQSAIRNPQFILLMPTSVVKGLGPGEDALHLRRGDDGQDTREKENEGEKEAERA